MSASPVGRPKITFVPIKSAGKKIPDPALARVFLFVSTEDLIRVTKIVCKRWREQIMSSLVEPERLPKVAHQVKLPSERLPQETDCDYASRLQNLIRTRMPPNFIFLDSHLRARLAKIFAEFNHQGRHQLQLSIRYPGASKNSILFFTICCWEGTATKSRPWQLIVERILVIVGDGIAPGPPLNFQYSLIATNPCVCCCCCYGLKSTYFTLQIDTDKSQERLTGLVLRCFLADLKRRYAQVDEILRSTQGS